MSEASGARTLYYRRCGWCGAYEGTVDPDEPCNEAVGTDPDGEPYIMGPHQFGPLEEATDVAGRLEAQARAVEALREIAEQCRTNAEQCEGLDADPRIAEAWRETADDIEHAAGLRWVLASMANVDDAVAHRFTEPDGTDMTDRPITEHSENVRHEVLVLAALRDTETEEGEDV